MSASTDNTPPSEEPTTISKTIKKPASSSSTKGSVGLSEYLFGPKGYFNEFSDQQRLVRLNECSELQIALDECERTRRQATIAAAAAAVDATAIHTHNRDNATNQTSWKRFFWKQTQDEPSPKTTITNSSSTPTTNPSSSLSSSSFSTKRLEETRSGMKIARFYEWGLSNPAAKSTIAAMRGEGPSSFSSSSSSSSDGDDSLSAAATTASSSSMASKSMHQVRSITQQQKHDPTKELQAVHTMPPPTQQPSLVTETNTNTNDNDNSTTRQRTPSSCSRETHGLWACRALALGCASDLVQLKKCFRSRGDTNPEASYDAANGGGEDDDDGNHIGTNELCQMEQRQMVQCVMKNWKDLEERMKDR